MRQNTRRQTSTRRDVDKPNLTALFVTPLAMQAVLVKMRYAGIRDAGRVNKGVARRVRRNSTIILVNTF